MEENILKKANQKRLLGDIAIEGGNFTTAFFKKSTINDLFDNSAADNSVDDDDDISHDEDAHPGGQKDVKPVGNRDGEVAVCLDLTIVLAPVVHLCFVKMILILIIRITTSS